VLPESIRAIESLASANPPDVAVNLAGEDIVGKRWSPVQKRKLRDSRLRVTADLVAFIGRCETPPVLISGSAVGYYGARGDAVLDENEPPGDEFQSDLCRDWENTATTACRYGARVCLIRSGIVLDAFEGALAKMITPFKLGLGGHLGTGRQYLPWIHRRDEIRAIRFLIANADCTGAYNLTAPNPVTNREFTRTLAAVLHRPSIAKAPSPAVKLLIGERARLLLTGQRAVPAALQAAGFRFEYGRLEAALADLLGDHR
jgi:uncharacterized protein (TIGR01777 family)